MCPDYSQSQHTITGRMAGGAAIWQGVKDRSLQGEQNDTLLTNHAFPLCLQ